MQQINAEVVRMTGVDVRAKLVKSCECTHWSGQEWQAGPAAARVL